MSPVDGGCENEVVSITLCKLIDGIAAVKLSIVGSLVGSPSVLPSTSGVSLVSSAGSETSDAGLLFVSTPDTVAVFCMYVLSKSA